VLRETGSKKLVEDQKQANVNTYKTYFVPNTSESTLENRGLCDAGIKWDDYVLLIILAQRGTEMTVQKSRIITPFCIHGNRTSASTIAYHTINSIFPPRHVAMVLGTRPADLT
jgi:hypothetical protein